jgi:hypothetical protein
MIGQLKKLNSFGKRSYVIDLDKVFKIIIDEDDKGELIVKNYRRGIFKDKLLYSFSHVENWEIAIPFALYKLRDFSNANEKQGFKDSYWERTNELCLRSLPK